MTDERNYYYGEVDTVNHSYGFVEADDERITDDFIKISEEYHQQLINEQSEGKKIVFYDNQVFTTDEKYRYYVDDTGKWQKRSDDEVTALISQETNAQEIEDIKTELDLLDRKSIRAIRAGEADYIEQYEQEAQKLRERLQELGGSNE